MKQKNKSKRKDKVRLIMFIIISIIVIITGILYSTSTYKSGDFIGSILGIIIAITIFIFALIVFTRGNKDLKNGYPIQDERSKRVLEKASSKSFYISLYLLLLIGFLSDDFIKFRDVSQVTSVSVGIMGLLFLISWIYYNKKEF
jgi:hypothetical protein